MVPAGSTLADIVSSAILGGVTIVQLREKTMSTQAFLTTARAVHQVTQRHNVPLLINDRIDVALAVDAEGVHIGQDDMPLATARRLLGPDKIIGVSVGSPDEAREAIEASADYLGIGPCFDTKTKSVRRDELTGPRGVRAIWEAALQAEGPVPARAVAIGGIGPSNAAHVLGYSRSMVLPGTQARALDGLAVVSAIMAAASPRAAAAQLAGQIRHAADVAWPALLRDPGSSSAEIVSAIADVFSSVRAPGAARPLVQHITNMVVINDSANACLALGGSPIMESLAADQQHLVPLASSLLVNIGTLDLAAMAGMRAAMRAAGEHHRPVVLDPVAVGATPTRRALVAELLEHHGACVVKANAGEVAALLGSAEVPMNGVDSVGGGFADPAAAVRRLSAMHRCVVAMTGRVDYVSNCAATVAVRNGHALQAEITGAGCMAGTAVAVFVGAARANPLLGALAGIVAINLAAEHAARRPDVHGPGSFRQALFDEMHALTRQHILDEAAIELVPGPNAVPL
ncbi:thiamine biosynthetic bifunctional enzyme [Coemansia erecta]|uniref:Thiamine biosynthetic bifunctional enzyme n=1 Tax=Coemansia erecta TaxID=147472 RepID=A0A9W7XU86_9FUNG|nr:thiamine biosynthetic bifunctional enzyme [Coemansia erecta]